VKRILVTGGSSYLGQHLVPIAAERYDVCYTFFSQDPLGLSNGRKVDLRDGPAVEKLVTAWQPEVIIHTAGSNRSADMEAVICSGARHISEAAAAGEARLIHISSDVVFDGRHAPYLESAPPYPLHAYGRAKAMAEEIVSATPNHVIVRTSLIYGLEIMDRSTEWITTSLGIGQPVTLFSDQIRNPVWAGTLSQACLELAELDYRGILNVAGRQILSRADFGLKLLDWWGFDEREGLTVGLSDPAFPLDCRLDIALAESFLSTPLPGVDDVLNAQWGQPSL
jgi:dTDP-4-dehydrorhamnose reductase